MLGRLTINTTQSCNLGCVYCYAEGGNYGGNPLRLTSKNAISALHKIVKLHNNIELVQFIGGEPLLNITVMLDVCSTLNDFVEEGILKNIPKVAAITNLTVLSDKHLKLFKEFNFNITVSLDGSKDIHDELRPSKKNKKGTHEIIIKNIDKLKNNNIPISFETTYTRLHYKKGITFIDLLNYLKIWNPMSMDIIVASLPNGDPNNFSIEEMKEVLNLQINAINYCIDSIGHGDFIKFGLLTDVIKIITSNNNITNNFCPAEISNLAISSDGNIYGCHMFTNKKQHLLDVDKYIYSESKNHYSKESNLPKKSDITECSTCWAQRWCKVCIGNMEIKSPLNPTPQWFNCELNKKTLQTVLQRLPSALDELLKFKNTI